jgi:hypothetical protein
MLNDEIEKEIFNNKKTKAVPINFVKNNRDFHFSISFLFC